LKQLRLFLQLQNFESATFALDMQTLSMGKEQLSTMVQSCKKEFDFALGIVTWKNSNVSYLKKLMEQMRLVIIKRNQKLHGLLVVSSSKITKASYIDNDIVKVRSIFMNFLNHIKFPCKLIVLVLASFPTHLCVLLGYCSGDLPKNELV
jgi:hypothetical protein